MPSTFPAYTHTHRIYLACRCLPPQYFFFEFRIIGKHPRVISNSKMRAPRSKTVRALFSWGRYCCPFPPFSAEPPPWLLSSEVEIVQGVVLRLWPHFFWTSVLCFWRKKRRSGTEMKRRERSERLLLTQQPNNNTILSTSLKIILQVRLLRYDVYYFRRKKNCIYQHVFTSPRCIDECWVEALYYQNTYYVNLNSLLNVLLYFGL